MSTRRFTAIALGLFVSAVFSWLALRRVALGDLLAAMQHVDFWILSLSLVTKSVVFLFMALRSRVLLRPLQPARMSELLQSVLLAFGGNNLLPLRVGELLRVDFLARHLGAPRAGCLAVIIFERLLDVCCLLAIFLITIPLVVADLPIDASIYLAAGVVTAAVGISLLVSRHAELVVRLCQQVSSVFGDALSQAVARKVSQLTMGLGALKSASDVATVVLFTFGQWLAGLCSIRICMWAFDLSVPWYGPILVLGFVSFGSALPSSPAFIGTYHYFASAALELLDIDRATALSFAIVTHAVAFGPFTLLAIAVFGYRWTAWSVRH